MATEVRGAEARELGPLAGLVADAVERLDAPTRKIVTKRIRAGRWQVSQIDGRAEWLVLVSYRGELLPVTPVSADLVEALHEVGFLDGDA
ncbi:hypothetical protein [Actinomadura sp. 9N215]|uniref:hypothetical protein n=1 Tax=Actinomadura sp. 9N215 TaxID=3375150 RepID=UPI0037A04B1E